MAEESSKPSKEDIKKNNQKLFPSDNRKEILCVKCKEKCKDPCRNKRDAESRTRCKSFASLFQS